jgi:hypothetical protein
LVPVAEDVVDVLHHHAHDDGMKRVERPCFQKPRPGFSSIVTEQRRAVGIGLVEIEGDIEGIGNDAAIVVQDRNHFRNAALHRRDGGEGGRLRGEVENLVGERHSGAPAMGAEAQVGIAPTKIVENARHEAFYS